MYNNSEVSLGACIHRPDVPPGKTVKKRVRKSAGGKVPNCRDGSSMPAWKRWHQDCVGSSVAAHSRCAVQPLRRLCSQSSLGYKKAHFSQRLSVADLMSLWHAYFWNMEERYASTWIGRICGSCYQKFCTQHAKKTCAVTSTIHVGHFQLWWWYIYSTSSRHLASFPSSNILQID